MNWNIGVINRPKDPVAPVPRTVADAEAFVEAIAGRYAARTVTASRAEIALAYQPAGQVNYFQSAPRIHVSPAVTVNEWKQFAGISRNVAAGPDRSAGFSDAQAEALFERLFSRHVRIAPFLPRGDRETPVRGEAIPLRPFEAPGRVDVVERFLLRRATAEERLGPAGPAPPVRPGTRDHSWEALPAAPAAPKPITLPAPEIQRVADQVMREIDHRIISRRERTGKI